MKCNELMVGDWIADALGIPMQRSYPSAIPTPMPKMKKTTTGSSLKTRNASLILFS